MRRQKKKIFFVDCSFAEFVRETKATATKERIKISLFDYPSLVKK